MLLVRYRPRVICPETVLQSRIRLSTDPPLRSPSFRPFAVATPQENSPRRKRPPHPKPATPSPRSRLLESLRGSRRRLRPSHRSVPRQRKTAQALPPLPLLRSKCKCPVRKLEKRSSRPQELIPPALLRLLLMYMLYSATTMRPWFRAENSSSF